MQFNHIGVVVATLDEGRSHFQRLLNVQKWTMEFIDSINQVRAQFGIDASGICYEIIAPYGDNSPVMGALRKADRRLNHVAYLVPDLDVASQQLCSAGSVAAGRSQPGIAFGMRQIQFFMTPLGMIVELIEAPDHQHAFIPGGFPNKPDTDVT